MGMSSPTSTLADINAVMAAETTSAATGHSSDTWGRIPSYSDTTATTQSQDPHGPSEATPGSTAAATGHAEATSGSTAAANGPLPTFGQAPPLRGGAATPSLSTVLQRPSLWSEQG